MIGDMSLIHDEGVFKIKRLKNGTYKLALSELGHRLARYHFADEISEEPEERRDFAAIVAMLSQAMQNAAFDMADDEHPSE